MKRVVTRNAINESVERQMKPGLGIVHVAGGSIIIVNCIHSTLSCNVMFVVQHNTDLRSAAESFLFCI